MAADPVEIDGEIREILDFLESHKDNPDLLRRFVEEAQIGGQLQHPGIVPIYELGTFADHRPFFALKLVKGRTLASLLAERSDPARDLPRFLAIFESICQTMALLMPAA
jgi:serine/threonine protein kinase